MQIEDCRTDEQREATTEYVNATDDFLSGWGKATGGKSYYSIACENAVQVHNAKKWLKSRDEMKRVAESLKPRTGRGCHTAIVHYTDTAAIDGGNQ